MKPVVPTAGVVAPGVDDALGSSDQPALPVAPVRGRYAQAVRSGKGLTGSLLIALVVLVSLAGPLLLSYGPYEQGPDALATPDGSHWLGTDEVGRDLLARVLAGARIDLLITLIAVPVAGVLGTLLGLMGMFSRSVGVFVDRLFDVLLGVPAIVLGIGVAIALTPGRESVIIAIILVVTPIFGRQARIALLGQLPLDYVAACEVLGYPKRRILRAHILPNIIDVIFVRFAVEVAHAIMIEGGLSVIGLGIQSPDPSLGSMIKEGGAYLLGTPLYALAPVAVVVVLVLGCTLLSDALNAAVLRR